MPPSAALFMFGGAAAGRLQHTGLIISYGMLPPAWLLLQLALDRRSILIATAFAFVAAALVKIEQFKLFFGGGEIEIGIKERVIGDLAESGVGDLSLPALQGAGGDAQVGHRQGGLQLAGENLAERFTNSRFGWLGRRRSGARRFFSGWIRHVIPMDPAAGSALSVISDQ